MHDFSLSGWPEIRRQDGRGEDLELKLFMLHYPL